MKSEIFRHKTSHMVLSIIFPEDKHNILLHLSIFYEYQQFVQHRICFSDFYVNLRDEVGKHPQVILAMYFYLRQE
jgi:hypothetical protein